MKKHKFLKVEIIIIALNLILLMIKLDFRAFYAFGLGIIIILLLALKMKIKDEKKELGLNIFIGIVALILTIVRFNMGEIYFYLAFIDGMHFKNKKIKIIASITTVSQYVIAIIGLNLRNGNTEWITNMVSFLSPYIGFTFFILILHIRSKDKVKIRELNDELMEQNRKLKEYSEQVEALTLEKERNRVAQDLHDSLGHYLMAISMHVNMIEKFNEDEEKRKELILKTKGIVKDSIVELRSTVYKLKEYEKEVDFIKKVDEIQRNLTGEIKFENEIEKCNSNVKNVLYIIKKLVINYFYLRVQLKIM